MNLPVVLEIGFASVPLNMEVEFFDILSDAAGQGHTGGRPTHAGALNVLHVVYLVASREVEGRTTVGEYETTCC